MAPKTTFPPHQCERRELVCFEARRKEARELRQNGLFF
jgi:hypothetical protein